MSLDMEAKARYINPFTDFGFKKLFGTEANKELLMNFLQVLLQKEGKIIEMSYIDYKNSEQLGISVTDRKAIFDIYCVTDRGERFIVEMQKAKQDFFKDRSVFYSTFPIREQAMRGEWNFELNAVYTVGILDFVFNEDRDDRDKYVYHIQLSDTETHEVFYDKLTFVYLEMPKFTKTEDQLDNMFDKWMFVLKNLAKLQDRPEALQERIFTKLFRIAEIEKLNKVERVAYEESLKSYWDFINVINSAVGKIAREKDAIIKEKEDAIKEKEDTIKEKEDTIKEKDEIIVRTVEKLIAMGFSSSQIADTTGMDIKRIEEIRKRNE